MSKTVFVIGANAAMAQDAIRRLSADYTVITGGRKDCDVYCDIQQPITIPEGVDVVLNIAAAFGGTEDQEIRTAVQTNTLGMLHICMAAQQAGVEQVVMISSLSAVHDASSPYYTSYALTKRQGDELAEWYCRLHSLPLTILRPSQLYGDTSALAAHQPFFYRMIDTAAQGQDVTIYGKHDALRNYLHVTDLSEIIARVIAGTATGTYACMYPTDVTFSEIARTAQRVFAKGGTVTFLEDKPDIPDNIFSKDLTIYDTIGYAPQMTLEAGIQRIKTLREGV